MLAEMHKVQIEAAAVVGETESTIIGGQTETTQTLDTLGSSSA